MPRRNSLLLFASLILVCFQILGCGCNGYPKIKITGSFAATGTVGATYGPPNTIMATGGKGTLIWGAPSGLPPGVVVEQTPGPGSLTIGGTPTTAGSYNVSATVTDSKGHSATYTVTIVISAAPGVSISGSLPATGTVGTAYTGSLTASGGATPYSWTVTGLPTGVTASGTSTATVTAAGTPTAAGTFSVTATVTDANSKTANYTVSVVIAAAPALAISGTLAATGTVGTAYSGSLMAMGGAPPYSWMVTGLPANLTITGASTATVSISGMPTTAGSYPVTAKVTDSKSASATYNVTIVVSSATGATLTINPMTLGTLTNGTQVTPITLTATPAGTPTYLWTVTAGALPAGLVMNNGTTTSATGINSTTNSITITGTPTTTGSYSFTLSIQDSASPRATGSQAFSGSVNAGGSAACGPPASGTLPVRGNESALKGLSFAYVLSGDDGNDAPIDWAGSFTADGSGGITAADLDFVGQTDGPSNFQVQLAGSSYSYGSDGRGCLYIAINQVNGAAKPASSHAASLHMRHGKATKRAKSKVRPAVLANVGTVTFSFSLSLGYQFGNIEEFDYINSFLVAAGQIHQQTPSDFAISKLASNFAFGLSGWFVDVTGGEITRTGIAGSFVNTGGVLSNGTADLNVGGTGGVFSDLSGGNGALSQMVSSTTGRGTGTYTIPNGESTVTLDFAFYIINSSDLFVITSNSTTEGNVILAGRALKSLASSVNLNGYFMPALSGIDLSLDTPDGNNVVAIGTLQATSSGTIPKATIYTNDAGTFQSQSYTGGSYTVDAATGRLTIVEVGNHPPVGYLTDPAVAALDSVSAFLVGTDDDVLFGFLALQSTTAPNLSTASISGQYTFGSTEDVTGVAGSATGAFDFPSTAPGTYTATIDTVNVGESASLPNQAASGTITVNADGSGLFDGGKEAFVTNGPLILGIDDTNGSMQPFLYIFVAQQVAP